MFCKQCGTQMNDGAIFCTNCGTKVTTTVGMHKITVVKKNQFFLYNPPIKILIDNNQNLQVKNGETIQFDLPDGKHQLKFSASMQNKIIDVFVQQDIVLEVHWDRIMGGLIVKQIG